MVVACGVPAGKWPCPGGAGWRRASTGAEIACGGDASWWRDDVAGHVCDARRARSVVHGHVWACLGVYGLVRLVHKIVEAGVWHDQGSVESKCDKVVHAGEGQRERWHGDGMVSTGMEGFGQDDQCPVLAGAGADAER